MSGIPDLSDLIGVPFRNHGRNASEGFDCYGLAIEVSRRFGHELDDLWYRLSTSDTFAENADSMIRRMSAKVSETDGQEPGDLVVFMEMGRMVHIGVVVDSDMFMHCDRYGGRIQRLSEYYRKDWKVYRWL